MAMIDTSKIEGYESMTAEEKLAALESVEFDLSGYVSKDTADKYASEAAQYKRQLKERMSAEEAEKAQRDEDQKALKEELENLRRERSIDQTTARFMGLGFDEKLAAETAKAYVDGDSETVFKNQAKFLVDREKAIKAEVIRNTPTPPAGNGDNKISKEDFQKMNLVEKQKFAVENPERYKEFYGGN